MGRVLADRDPYTVQGRLAKLWNRRSLIELCVAIAAFNEEPSLVAAVREINAQLEAMAVRSEILIVDDGSSDATPRLADELALQLPRVRVIHHAVNRGLGGFYRTVFDNVRATAVTFFPADGQFPPDIIPYFWSHFDGVEMVLGVLPDRRDSLLMRLLAGSERLLYRMLFGDIPEFKGICMFRCSVLEQVTLTTQGRGWGILMELLVRAHQAGFRHINLAIRLLPRRDGRSRAMGFRAIWSNTMQAFKLRYRLFLAPQPRLPRTMTHSSPNRPST